MREAHNVESCGCLRGYSALDQETSHSGSIMAIHRRSDVARLEDL